MAKSIKSDINALTFGRLPPQAREMEEAIIGACLLEKETFADVLDIIYSPECFYIDNHKKIWTAMCAVYHGGDMVDLLTVIQQLRKNGDTDLANNPAMLIEISQSVVSSAHVQTHARVVMEKFMLREAIKAAGEILNAAYLEDVDVFDLLDSSELKIKNITAHIVSGDSISVTDSYQKVVANYQKQKEQLNSLIGISTGLYDFDRIMMGWRVPTLNLIGAHPSMGKTSLMLHFLKSAAMNKIACDVYSLETGDMSLTTRLVASIEKIPLEAIMKGQLNPQQEVILFSAHKIISTLKISISQKTFFIEDIERSARKKKKKNPDLGLIAVDFIQLVKMKTPGKKNSDEVIAYVSRQLKILSAELQIPIISLSQLTRDALDGKDARPKLRHLAGSRELEWNADTVTFIHYEKGEPMLILAKNKDGKCDAVKVKFDADTQAWSDYNDMNENILPGIFKTANNFQVSSQDKKDSWSVDSDAPF